jgi:hypothetical protein
MSTLVAIEYDDLFKAEGEQEFFGNLLARKMDGAAWVLRTCICQVRPDASPSEPSCLRPPSIPGPLVSGFLPPG